jgi:hypothetical protein
LKWEIKYLNKNSVQYAKLLTHPQGLVVNSAMNAAQHTKNAAKNTEQKLILKKGTTKAEKITITGAEERLNTAKKSLTNTTEKYANFVKKTRYWYTTKTKTEKITQLKIYNRYANTVTKPKHITAPITYQKKLYLKQNYVNLVKTHFSQQAPEVSNAMRVGVGTKLIEGIVSATGNSGIKLSYGKAARSLAKELGFFDKVKKEHPNLQKTEAARLAKRMAQDLIDKFFSKIPGVYNFIQNTKDTLSDTKFAESYLGRRRWFPDVLPMADKIMHEHVAKKSRQTLCWCPECKLSRDAERQAVNAKIQTTAADIAMCAMLKCDNDKELKQLGCRLLLQVHDELIFEVPEDNVEKVLPIIQQHMEHPGITLSVPLRAEPNVGNSWAEAK